MAAVSSSGTGEFTACNIGLARSSQKLCAVSNIAVQVMTKIGAICLVTIGTWVVIEMAVQFGAYRHTCAMGAGAFPGSAR